MIHFEQDPPLYADTSDGQADRFGTVDFPETYVLDLPNMPAEAAELIARYTAEGVNTTVFLGDPFMPG